MSCLSTVIFGLKTIVSTITFNFLTTNVLYGGKIPQSVKITVLYGSYSIIPSRYANLDPIFQTATVTFQRAHFSTLAVVRSGPWVCGKDVVYANITNRNYLISENNIFRLNAGLNQYGQLDYLSQIPEPFIDILAVLY